MSGILSAIHMIITGMLLWLKAPLEGTSAMIGIDDGTSPRECTVC